MCLILESVIGEIRSGCIERVVLLAIVWQMSWGVSILQLDERLVDESHHIYGWPVSGEGLSRRSVVGRRCTNQSKRKQAPDSR